MKLLKVLTILVIALAMFGCFRAIHTVNKAINNGFDTAYQEFKPETLLKKYSRTMEHSVIAFPTFTGGTYRVLTISSTFRVV